MQQVALALATALGVGYAPVAPGTFGSLVGLILWWLLPQTAVVQVVTIGGLFVAGSWAATIAEHRFGRTDPGYVVVDEVMGMVIGVALIPISWPGAIAGFLLFRLFDVVKPFPVNRFERLPGGIGIMADDAMAGVYANLALRVLVWAVPTWNGWTL